MTDSAVAVDVDAGRLELAQRLRCCPRHGGVLPGAGGQTQDGELFGVEADLGKLVGVLGNSVAQLVIEEGVVAAGLERDTHVAQVILVALEHALEGLGRGARPVLRNGSTDLLLVDVPGGSQEADHQVEQSFGPWGSHELSLAVLGTWPGLLSVRRYLLRTVNGVIRWRSGRVVEIRSQWGTALELGVTLEGTDSSAPQLVRALAYTDVVGSPRLGEEVLLNVTALDLELGTGGYALVAAIPSRLPEDPVGPGHLVKARYTPLQMTVLGVDEQESPHHALLREADDLTHMPVVTADLHSALPAIVTGIRDSRPDAVSRVRRH